MEGLVFFVKGLNKKILLEIEVLRGMAETNFTYRESHDSFSSLTRKAPSLGRL